MFEDGLFCWPRFYGIGLPLVRDIEKFKRLVNGYIIFFNNIRISLKTDGLSPVEYRNQQLAA
ncbi:IS3 family transposase [Limosilactobacillus mucosae]